MNEEEPTRLGIVIPCFNEAQTISETSEKLAFALKNLIRSNKINPDSRIYFIDDGSNDGTWDVIIKLKENYPEIKGISLARNVGHQNALLAGLMKAKENSDCVISMDADLQDDVEALANFLDKYHEGYEIVYGVRKKRESDTLFKRGTAALFYKIMNILGVEIIYNHADFRLVSKRALESLAKFEEVNLFLRGIFPLIGFRSTIIFYDRKKRVAGETKYPLRKMLSLAFDGITSFSIKPLRFVTLTGFIIFLASLFIGLYILFEALIKNKTVVGWASTVLSIYVLGGIQILSIGIIGEYIGKVYQETKRRPRYIIKDEI